MSSKGYFSLLPEELRKHVAETLLKHMQRNPRDYYEIWCHLPARRSQVKECENLIIHWNRDHGMTIEDYKHYPLYLGNGEYAK